MYRDVHVRRVVTNALRLRSIDVLTAQKNGTSELDDNKFLDKATELSRVLVSQDEDLLRERARRQIERISRALSMLTKCRTTIGPRVGKNRYPPIGWQFP